MRTILIFCFFIIGSCYAHTYSGISTQAQTRACARSQLIIKSIHHYPFPHFTKITKLENTNILPFWLRRTHEYSFEAVNSDGDQYHGFIIVSNFQTNDYVNGQRVTNTVCRLHIPMCNDHIMGYYTLKIFDSRNVLIMDRYNRSCALEQRPLPRLNH